MATDPKYRRLQTFECNHKHHEDTTDEEPCVGFLNDRDTCTTCGCVAGDPESEDDCAICWPGKTHAKFDMRPEEFLLRLAYHEITPALADGVVSAEYFCVVNVAGVEGYAYAPAGGKSLREQFVYLLRAQALAEMQL